MQQPHELLQQIFDCLVQLGAGAAAQRADVLLTALDDRLLLGFDISLSLGNALVVVILCISFGGFDEVPCFSGRSGYLLLLSSKACWTAALAWASAALIFDKISSLAI